MMRSVVASLEQNHNKIEEWYKAKCKELRNLESYQQNFFPIYSSIDIRESNFKIAPVDVNLFPSGFNNFMSNCEAMSMIEGSFQGFFTEHCNENIYGKRVALIVENFTRNEKYLKNVDALKMILQKCGAIVETYTLDEEGRIVPFGEEKRCSIENVDIIILNNDLSVKIPQFLLETNIKILPNPVYGWCMRRKSIHFQYYNNLVDEMCGEVGLDIDPWFLSSYIDSFQGINFRDKSGLEELSPKVEKLLNRIEKKYIENNIDSTPHVFIKANGGTFGLGVMMVSSVEGLRNINKKTRHTISTLKNGVPNSDVIIQEGIPTRMINSIDTSPAEHVIYSVGKDIIGVLMRFHSRKDYKQSLNAPGMQMLLLSEKPTVTERVIVNLSKLAVMLEGINSR